MSDTNCINFKLEDPELSHKSVNVAGTFNDWNPSTDALDFDENTKSWIKQLIVDYPKDQKVLYKYIIDNNNWICDLSKPHEKDQEGNDNNIGFVILKQTIVTTEGSSNKPDDGDVEVFDHKSFHEDELFDANEQSVPIKSDTAPTSGEENITAEDSTEEAEQAQDHLIDPVSSKPIDQSAIPLTPNYNDFTKNDDEFSFKSVWESIKWFFKYYILSLFVSKPQNDH